MSARCEGEVSKLDTRLRRVTTAIATRTRPRAWVNMDRRGRWRMTPNVLGKRTFSLMFGAGILLLASSANAAIRSFGVPAGDPNLCSGQGACIDIDACVCVCVPG
jgi:hypothetical protein